MIERAALLRRKASLLGELAQIELELAALEDQEPAAAAPKARRPRLVRVAPPAPVHPLNPPTDTDRARARKDLSRLGHVPGKRKPP